MNLVLDPLKIIVGVVGIFWLAILGGFLVYKYDRAPVGWPNATIGKQVISWPVKCCQLTLHLPGAGAITVANQKISAYQKANAAAQAAAKAVEANDAAISAAAVTHDTQAQAVIVTRWRTQIREVPTYVTPQVDADFPVPWSVVRVFNAGAAGLDLSAVSLPAGATDDAASSVKASQLSDAILGNDKVARANAQQLIDLQGWVSQVQASHAVKP